MPGGSGGVDTACLISLMAWAVSNVRIELKGNAIVIAKHASGTATIDPLMVAAFLPACLGYIRLVFGHLISH